MRVDLRVKHDVEARKAAIGLFELGHGYKSAAIALSLPVEAVRRWQEIYRAFGSEVLLRMDGKQGRYTYEQKVAGGRRDLLAHRQRLRAPADSDVPQGGRGGRDSRQDRAQDDARDGDPLRHQTRDGLPQVQLVQGRRRQDVRERDREGFRRRGPVAEAGNGRHRVQGGGRQGLLGPDAGLLHQGDRGERHIDHDRHGPAGEDARRAAAQDPRGRRPDHALGPGLAVPARLVHIQARGRRHRPEHVQEGELHRQRRHRAALRPRQGRVLPGPRVEDVRGFQTRPGGIHSPLEHEPEAGKIEGPDPGGVPESGPRGLVAI